MLKTHTQRRSRPEKKNQSGRKKEDGRWIAAKIRQIIKQISEQF